MRVQFDIPETEMGQAAMLILMRGKRLRLTVEVLPDAPAYGGRLKDGS